MRVAKLFRVDNFCGLHLIERKTQPHKRVDNSCGVFLGGFSRQEGNRENQDLQQLKLRDVAYFVSTLIKFLTVTAEVEYSTLRIVPSAFYVAVSLRPQ